MDILYIEQLRVYTTIGVYAWEQAIRQPLLLDLKVSYDSTFAVSHDTLYHALDYTALCKTITTYLSTHRFSLLETAASGIAILLQHHFGIAWIQLKVSKPTALSAAKTVGVIIERGQKPKG